MSHLDIPQIAFAETPPADDSIAFPRHPPRA
jgi:hypothetical protein